MEDAQTQFRKASELMDMKYKSLNQRFFELQDLYENRPSRPEDLEMIRSMQEDNMTKDGLLKKAAEDMKWFKLELVNRDKAYTEIFGNNPNVGNIDPRLMQAQNVSLFWFIWVARKTKSPSEIRKYGTRSRRQECTAQLREKELQDERMNNINLMDTYSNH